MTVLQALIIDTETDQGKDPRPIQVATIDLATGEEWMAYFNSGRAISAFTTQIHGITDADVVGLPSFELAKFAIPEYLIGHNVRFDWRVIGSPEAKLICTVKLARLAFPEWDSYKQGRCIEQLLAGQGESGARRAAILTMNAHDALGDVRMCQLIYTACCERLGIAANDYAAAYVLSERVSPNTRRQRTANHTTKTAKSASKKASTLPSIYAPFVELVPTTLGQNTHSQKKSSKNAEVKMPFGKHKGTAVADLPKNYAKWLLQNIPDLRPNLLAALTLRVKE